jgi:predicted TIM-barrel fold metal-dependent hydrolase
VGERDLALVEFAPRSMLKIEGHAIHRPRFPVIDAHNHLGASFPGVREMPTSDIMAVLDESGVEAIVDLDGGQGAALATEIERWQTTDRVLVFAGLDYPMWANEDRFGEVESQRLRESFHRGARGLKVWKSLGLRARDARGTLVAVDDQRLDPLFEAAGELGLPVVIHVSDPFAFFQPLDRTNERWEELHANPDWHFWPTGGEDTPEAARSPRAEDVLAGLDHRIGRHPTVTFVGAHVASAAEDLAFVSELLGRHPNLYVDIAERINELGRQPYTARSFFLEHADRILFGLDRPVRTDLYRIHYRFLETLDESFDYGVEAVPRQGRWQIHGLGLPDEVLRGVYSGNARRILWPSR